MLAILAYADLAETSGGARFSWSLFSTGECAIDGVSLCPFPQCSRSPEQFSSCSTGAGLVTRWSGGHQRFNRRLYRLRHGSNMRSRAPLPNGTSVAKSTSRATSGSSFSPSNPDEVRARMPIERSICAWNGFLHAGAVVSLADSCCGYATLRNLPEDADSFTTIEL